MTQAPQAPGPPPAGSSEPKVGLVIGIFSLVCCHILGPVAWYMGYDARRAIRAGRAPAGDETLATIAMVLGMLATALLAVGLAWVLFFGGLVTLAALFGHH